MQRFGRRIRYQFIDVGPLEWISIGKNKNGRVELLNVIDQLLTLLRAELKRIAAGLGGGAAMKACEVAGARNFLDQHQRGLVQIQVAFHVASIGSRRPWAL